MPAFFSISGFLFGLKEWGCSSLKIIRKKIVALGIPYIFFSYVYLGLKSFLQNFLIVNQKVEKQDFLKVFFFPELSVSVYWFLYVLILYFAIAAFTKKSFFASMFFSFLSLIYFIFWKAKILFIFNDCFNSFLGYFFCFTFASFLGKRYLDFMQKKYFKIVFFISAFILSTSSLIAFFCFSGSHKFLHILFLTGGISLLFLLGALPSFLHASKLFVLIGDFSWFIYLLHPYFLNLIRNILLKTTVISNFLYIMLNIIVGVFLPIFIAFVIEHFKYIDFVFYPTRYIKEK